MGWAALRERWGGRNNWCAGGIHIRYNMGMTLRRSTSVTAIDIA